MLCSACSDGLRTLSTTSLARELCVLGVFHNQAKVYAMFKPVPMVVIGDVTSTYPLSPSELGIDTGTGRQTESPCEKIELKHKWLSNRYSNRLG